MPLITRFFALFLSVFYFFSQVVLGSAQETNIWKERRTLVALPMGAPARALPSALRASMPAIAVMMPSSLKNIAPEFQPLLRAIPMTAATVQDVWTSSRRSTTPVLLVQDIHLNSEAQLNIATMLQSLVDGKQAGLVAVEGAFGPLPLKPFRDFSDKTILKTVSQSLLDHALLAAPAFVGMTSATEPPPFVGVDDRAHHAANVNAYLDARSRVPAVQVSINAFEKNLSEQKKKIFSAPMRRFDDVQSAYDKGSIGLGVYAQQLSRLSEPADLVIDQFLQAVAMEKSLDFPAVERERQAVVEKLSHRLSQNELQDLVDRSIAYRAGRLGFGNYYRGLRQLCERKGIVLSQTRAFGEYIRYALLSDGIKADALFEALDRWRHDIVDKLAVTPEARRVADQGELLSLAQKLTMFSLTAHEWDKYKTASRLDLLPELAADFKPFERFYDEADIRSGKMVDALLSLRSAARSSVASVLVVGGFHTPQIAQLLKQRGISYAVVSPKITKVDGNAAAYLSVFAREKAPLEKLFEGEKLFVAPSEPNLGNSFRDAVWYASMRARQLLPGIGAIAVMVPRALGFSRADVNLEITVTDRNDASSDIPSVGERFKFLSLLSQWRDRHSEWITTLLSLTLGIAVSGYMAPVFGLEFNLFLAIPLMAALTVSTTLTVFMALQVLDVMLTRAPRKNIIYASYVATANLPLLIPLLIAQMAMGWLGLHLGAPTTVQIMRTVSSMTVIVFPFFFLDTLRIVNQIAVLQEKNAQKNLKLSTGDIMRTALYWFGFRSPRSHTLWRLFMGIRGSFHLEELIDAFLSPIQSQLLRAKLSYDKMHAMNMPMVLSESNLQKAKARLQEAQTLIDELMNSKSSVDAFEFLKSQAVPVKPKSHKQQILDAAVSMVWSDDPQTAKQMRGRYLFVEPGTALAAFCQVKEGVADARHVAIILPNGDEFRFVAISSDLSDIENVLPIAVHEGFHMRYQTPAPESADESLGIAYFFNEGLIERKTRAAITAYLATAQGSFAARVKKELEAYLNIFSVDAGQFENLEQRYWAEYAELSPYRLPILFFDELLNLMDAAEAAQLENEIIEGPSFEKLYARFPALREWEKKKFDDDAAANEGLWKKLSKAAAQPANGAPAKKESEPKEKKSAARATASDHRKTVAAGVGIGFGLGASGDETLNSKSSEADIQRAVGEFKFQDPSIMQAVVDVLFAHRGSSGLELRAALEELIGINIKPERLDPLVRLFFPDGVPDPLLKSITDPEKKTQIFHFLTNEILSTRVGMNQENTVQSVRLLINRAQKILPSFTVGELDLSGTAAYKEVWNTLQNALNTQMFIPAGYLWDISGLYNVDVLQVRQVGAEHVFLVQIKDTIYPAGFIERKAFATGSVAVLPSRSSYENMYSELMINDAVIDSRLMSLRRFLRTSARIDEREFTRAIFEEMRGEERRHARDHAILHQRRVHYGSEEMQQGVLPGFIRPDSPLDLLVKSEFPALSKERKEGALSEVHAGMVRSYESRHPFHLLFLDFAIALDLHPKNPRPLYKTDSQFRLRLLLSAVMGHATDIPKDAVEMDALLSKLLSLGPDPAETMRRLYRQIERENFFTDDELLSPAPPASSLLHLILMSKLIHPLMTASFGARADRIIAMMGLAWVLFEGAILSCVLHGAGPVVVAVVLTLFIGAHAVVQRFHVNPAIARGTLLTDSAGHLAVLFFYVAFSSAPFPSWQNLIPVFMHLVIDAVRMKKQLSARPVMSRSRQLVFRAMTWALLGLTMGANIGLLIPLEPAQSIPVVLKVLPEKQTGIIRMGSVTDDRSKILVQLEKGVYRGQMMLALEKENPATAVDLSKATEMDFLNSDLTVEGDSPIKVRIGNEAGKNYSYHISLRSFLNPTSKKFQIPIEFDITPMPYRSSFQADGTFFPQEGKPFHVYLRPYSNDQDVSLAAEEGYGFHTSLISEETRSEHRQFVAALETRDGDTVKEKGRMLVIQHLRSTPLPLKITAGGHPVESSVDVHFDEQHSHYRIGSHDTNDTVFDPSPYFKEDHYEIPMEIDRSPDLKLILHSNPGVARIPAQTRAPILLWYTFVSVLSTAMFWSAPLMMLASEKWQNRVGSQRNGGASTWPLTLRFTRQLNRWWPDRFGGLHATESDLIEVAVTRVAPFFEGTLIAIVIFSLSIVSPPVGLMIGNTLFALGHWSGLYKTADDDSWGFFHYRNVRDRFISWAILFTKGFIFYSPLLISIYVASHLNVAAETALVALAVMWAWGLHQLDNQRLRSAISRALRPLAAERYAYSWMEALFVAGFLYLAGLSEPSSLQWSEMIGVSLAMLSLLSVGRLLWDNLQEPIEADRSSHATLDIGTMMLRGLMMQSAVLLASFFVFDLLRIRLDEQLALEMYASFGALGYLTVAGSWSFWDHFRQAQLDYQRLLFRGQPRVALRSEKEKWGDSAQFDRLKDKSVQLRKSLARPFSIIVEPSEELSGVFINGLSLTSVRSGFGLLGYNNAVQLYAEGHRLFFQGQSMFEFSAPVELVLGQPSTLRWPGGVIMAVVVRRQGAYYAFELKNGSAPDDEHALVVAGSSPKNIEIPAIRHKEDAPEPVKTASLALAAPQAVEANPTPNSEKAMPPSPRKNNSALYLNARATVILLGHMLMQAGHEYDAFSIALRNGDWKRLSSAYKHASDLAALRASIFRKMGREQRLLAARMPLPSAVQMLADTARAQLARRLRIFGRPYRHVPMFLVPSGLLKQLTGDDRRTETAGSYLSFFDAVVLSDRMTNDIETLGPSSYALFTKNILHEDIHAQAIENGFVSRWLEEGFIEYLALTTMMQTRGIQRWTLQDVLKESHVHKITLPDGSVAWSGYNYPLAVVTILVTYAGEKAFLKAYFDGDESMIRERLGDERWARILALVGRHDRDDFDNFALVDAINAMFEEQSLTPTALRQRLLDEVAALPLSLEVSSTGTKVGDASEIFSAHTQNPWELRRFSRSVRRVLTDENRDGLFAGSKGALLRETMHPLPSQSAAMNIVCEILDDADPQAALDRAEFNLRALRNAGNRTKLVFITSDKDLLEGGVTWAKQFGPSPVIFVDKAHAGTVQDLKENILLDQRFVTYDQWERAQIRLIVPRAFGDNLKAFINHADLSADRFHVYFSLTDKINSLLIELALPEIEKLDLGARSQWVSTILAQA